MYVCTRDAYIQLFVSGLEPKNRNVQLNYYVRNTVYGRLTATQLSIATRVVNSTYLGEKKGEGGEEYCFGFECFGSLRFWRVLFLFTNYLFTRFKILTLALK